jgi:F420-dependent oxidoreductase-like protein
MALLFGYHMPSFTFPGTPDDQLFDRVIELAQGAEAAGFDLVTVMDHLYQIRGVGPEEQPMLEAYTALGAIAARTSKVQLGTLVTGVTYRNPALLAKEVTTLDVISKGRAVLGIGAAWNEDEHKGYGFEFPPIGKRMDRLEEALTICKAMFTEERPSFEGRHYRIDRALNRPRPVRKGGLPILVGGGGEQRTLRIVARFADYSHWFGGPIEDLRRKHELLDRYCEEIGRDPGAVTRTIGAPILLVESEAEGQRRLEQLPPERRPMFRPATPDQAAEILHGFVDERFGGFTFNNPTLRTPEGFAMAAEVIKQLQGSRVA